MAESGASSDSGLQPAEPPAASEPRKEEAAGTRHRWATKLIKLWAWAERKVPLTKTLRQALSFITHRRRELDRVIESNRIFRSVGYFFACYGGVLLLMPFVPLANTAVVRWYEPASELVLADRVAFCRHLELLPFIDSGQWSSIATTEVLYPGRSPASDVVRRVAGSDEAEQVAFFLAKKDSRLADEYLLKAKRIKFVNKWLDRCTAGLATTAALVSGLPLLLIFKRPDRSWKQTLGVFMWFSGVWSLIAFLIVAIGRFVPLQYGFASVLFVLVEFTLAVWMVYDFCRVFHYTHGIGVGRALLGFAIYVITLLVVVASLGMVLQLVVERIADYFVSTASAALPFALPKTG